ncbi:hypothetical protein [Shimazuella alba]|uniref:Uncharacterized protein n=1 Tax=Shimazuella alba TaxID=2690964 RepID=A0A6I4VTS3_9BACL|nr:hypothetical protein [Shimazuella alba]MXQ54413.1 hypothetical protein [Shimazuella alba]
MKKIMILIATLIALIGIAHIAVTPLTFKSFHTDALWFGSAGLAFIFLAFLHIMLVIGDQRTLHFIFAYIGNGLSVILFILFLSIVSSPNFILLVVLVVIQTILFVLLQLKTRKTNKWKAVK